MPVAGLAETVTKKNTRTKGSKGASFPISQTNSYGRMMIRKQMDTHDHLIHHAGSRTDAWISRVAADQMEYNRKLEKWRPGYNALQRKARTDEILANLISTATHRCDTELDGHIVRFKENRARNPVYKPGWLEAFILGKNKAVHDELLMNVGPRIDNSPPKKALQFRDFLNSCKFTRGGFLRQEITAKARKNGKTKFPSIFKQPPPAPTLYVKQKQFDACGREKRVNPVLVNKYSEMLFQSHIANASNTAVRDIYAMSNNQEKPMPSMGQFLRSQGMDLDALEAELRSEQVTTPFGLASVQEGDEEGEEVRPTSNPEPPKMLEPEPEPKLGSELEPEPKLEPEQEPEPALEPESIEEEALPEDSKVVVLTSSDVAVSTEVVDLAS